MCETSPLSLTGALYVRSVAGLVTLCLAACGAADDPVSSTGGSASADAAALDASERGSGADGQGAQSSADTAVDRADPDAVGAEDAGDALTVDAQSPAPDEDGQGNPSDTAAGQAEDVGAVDAGSPSADVGSPMTDGGSSGEDAGAPSPDAGTTPDSGAPGADVDPAGQSGSGASDPGAKGSSKVVLKTAQVALQGGGLLPESLQLQIYLPDSPGPHPVVVFLHGFQLGPKDYASYGEHLASWGVAAVLPQLAAGNLFAPKDHTQLAGQVVQLIDWISKESGTGGQLGGAVDASALALAGHSLGGKLATWVATQDGRVKAVLAVDPVDGAPGSPLGPNPKNLSVTPELMPKLTVPSVFLGETTNAKSANPFAPACAPAEENFQQFFAAAQSASLQVEVVGASHMSFLDNPSCGLACIACPAGQDDPAKTRMFTRRLLVALVKVTLQSDKAYATWLSGAKAQADVAAGALLISSKNGF